MSLEGLVYLLSRALTELGIPFMLTGSVAAGYRGASRATMDVDVVIDPTVPQLRDFVRRVLDAGLYVSEEEEFARRESVHFLGVWLAIATLEDIVLSKLEWAVLGASSRQMEDVRALLRINQGAVDLAYIERWVDVLGVRRAWESVRS